MQQEKIHTEKKIEMHNNLVRHTMDSLSRLSAIDQRVVAYIISIGIKNPKNDDDEMPSEVEGSVKELANICGIQGDHLYTGVRKATESLMQQIVRFKDRDTGKDVSTTWLSEGIYSETEGTFIVSFSQSMRKMLTGLAKHRTQMELETLLSLGGSNYAIRLYQVAKSWQSEKYFTTSINGLRDMLGVPKGSYTRISDLRKMVLDYPIGIINDKSDIYITYEKHNYGRKWTHLAFCVSRKEKGPKQVKEVEEKKFHDLSEDEKRDLWAWIKTHEHASEYPESPDWTYLTDNALAEAVRFWRQDRRQMRFA